ncbi:MAG TPA: M3 family oligoendopeptidase [Gemmatimonadaceae bacterium]|nr:M3 family oligoendopeptidase [Gemmatimonadaceae bacterium]
MFVALPDSPQALAQATWADLAPLYEALATAPVTRDRAEVWLREWSKLEELIDEAGTLAMIAYTCDTTDPAKEEANLRWSSEIAPRAMEQQVRLARRLVALGFSRPDLETVLRGFRTDIEIFREENVPLFSALEELTTAYQKITGGLEVDWEGEKKTIPQLQPFLKERDRAVRERAFRLGAQAYLERRDEMAALFDRMYALRQDVAHHAGFQDFQAYVFRAKHRFDYSPGDCASFHRAVEAVVAPAVQRLMDYRRETLGVPTLRPWDTQVDLETTRPVKPFSDLAGFVQPAQRVFDALDPELGAQFRRMAGEALLDLESRPGKAPGGYCTNLSWRGLPFIFMNAVGVPDDVNTLVHEAGHSFHDFAAHRQPFIWQRSVTHEAAELASMSMELLVAPHLVRPTGYYTPEEARAAQVERLEEVLVTLAHIASVDAFQAWIYTSGQGGDAAARDAAWLELRARFERGVDWSGLERERVARWYRQLHIFEYPFYYIEYGIAQLGALQLWRASLDDPAGTLRRYKDALALGGTRSLPEIYRAAGARLIFDEPGMADLVDFVERQITILRLEREPAPLA